MDSGDTQERSFRERFSDSNLLSASLLGKDYCQAQVLKVTNPLNYDLTIAF